MDLSVLDQIGTVGCEQTLGSCTMTITLAIFFLSIVNLDQSIAKILLIHSLNSIIGGLEVIITHKSITTGHPSFGVSHNLKITSKENWNYIGREDHTKHAKSVIQHFFINIGIQIADPYISTYFIGLFILGCLVASNRFSIKLHKAITLIMCMILIA